MIKNTLISILVAILLLIVIISYSNKENASEPITLSPEYKSKKKKCANALECYERALQDLQTAEQQIVKLQQKNEQKAEKLQQRIEQLETLIETYQAELSTYTDTQKAAFDKRLENALNAQLTKLTMQYEEKILQDYTQQMRQLIDKLQRLNQADALFRFRDHFLEGVTDIAEVSGNRASFPKQQNRKNGAEVSGNRASFPKQQNRKNGAEVSGNRASFSKQQKSPMMIIIPEGHYTMGYVKTSEAIDPSLTQKILAETEIKVALKRFAISQHEVTVSDYAAFLNDVQHDSHFKYHPSKHTIRAGAEIIWHFYLLVIINND